MTPKIFFAAILALVPALPGQDQIDHCAGTWSSHADWENRAADLRKKILGPLAPWPRATPLNPLWRDRIDHDGYSVQPIAFESMPGFYCCANLYRPAPRLSSSPATTSP